MEESKTEVGSQFGVLARRGSPRPAAEIGRLVAFFLNAHPTDSTLRVRYGGGLLADGLTFELARTLVEKLHAIGVEACAFAMDLWTHVPRGITARRLKLDGETLVAEMVSGKRVEIPRSRIFALQTYGLKPVDRGTDKASRKEREMKEALLRQTTSSLPPALPPGAEPRATLLQPGELTPRGAFLRERLQEAGLLDLELHLALYADPEGPVRIRREDFDFSSLGGRTERHSLDGFLVLLEQVLEYLPDAWNREPTVEFLKDLDPQRIHCFKAEEAQNVERCLYEWARLEAGASTGEEPPPEAAP